MRLLARISYWYTYICRTPGLDIYKPVNVIICVGLGTIFTNRRKKNEIIYESLCQAAKLIYSVYLPTFQYYYISPGFVFFIIERF